MASRIQKPAWQKDIANERIEILFSEAEKAFRAKNTERAKNYIKMAHEMALRHRVRLGSERKKLFCKKCFSYLALGISATVRLNRQRLIITCKNCGTVKRFPYKGKADKKLNK